MANKDEVKIIVKKKKSRNKKIQVLGRKKKQRKRFVQMVDKTRVMGIDKVTYFFFSLEWLSYKTQTAKNNLSV